MNVLVSLGLMTLLLFGMVVAPGPRQLPPRKPLFTIEQLPPVYSRPVSPSLPEFNHSKWRYD